MAGDGVGKGQHDADPQRGLPDGLIGQAEIGRFLAIERRLDRRGRWRKRRGLAGRRRGAGGNGYRRQPCNGTQAGAFETEPE